MTNEALKALNQEELKDLARRVYGLIKERNGEKQRVIASHYMIGDNVSFRGRNLYRLKGKIEKINAKTISVKTESGIWRVSPSLLTKEP